MKVYFDVSSLNPAKITGIGVYMHQIFLFLKKQPDVDVVPVLKPSRWSRRKNLEAFLQTPIRLFWPWTGLRDKDALYHGPDFKILASRQLPRVVTIHDMVVFERKYNSPEFYQTGIKELSKVLQSSPDAIIANSHFTKSEIVKYFPMLQERIHVTHLGCDSHKQTETQTFSKSPETSDFILFLGTLEKRKNVIGVIKSFELLCHRGRKEKLVLAGAWGFGAEEIQTAIAESPFRDRMTHLNYVSNEKVLELYKTAKVFFFPSWYEGFGIPALEAMSMGCPVVSSSGGALEEICGDAAVLAPPDQPRALADALELVLSDTTLRQSLIAKGQLRVQRFLWEKCGQQTLEVYRKTLQSRNPHA